jgi:hypothetical protein
MDEITLFAELKPPPADTADLQASTRARLTRALRAPGPTATRPRRRHQLALGLSVAATAAVAATVVPSVLLGGSSPALVTSAYAITRNGDGTVTVTIYDIASAADAASLQRALRHEGIPARVWIGVPTDQNNGCQAPARDLEPQQTQRAVVATYLNGALIPPNGTVIAGLPAHLSPAERASLKRDPGLKYVIHRSAMPSGSALYLRKYTSGSNNQEIVPPEVLKHDRAPC